MSDEPTPAALPDGERRARFEAELANAARFGAVTPLGEYQAQLTVPARRVNHVLHLLLCLVSCFVWAPVWWVLSLRTRPETRRMIYVDELGQLWVDGQPTPPAT